MNTIFKAIEARLTDQEIKDLFTGAEETIPTRVILYNREYEEEEVDHIPPRPYLSVEFQDYEWMHTDQKEADVPVVIHVVQDVLALDEQQSKILDYVDLIVQAFDQLLVESEVMIHQDTLPEHNSRHYFVSKERFMVRVRR